MKYTDIKSIDNEKILFKDGTSIVFLECVNKKYPSSTCVAERDYSAKPPYFEFFTPVKPTRIVFVKFFKSSNSNDFLKLQKLIVNLGYTTYDLS